MQLAFGLTVLSVLVVLSAATQDKDVVFKQQKIAQLLSRLQQPTYFKEIYEVGNDYDIFGNVNAYKNTSRVKEVLFRYKLGDFFDNDQVQFFNFFNPKDLEKAHLLFDLFYYAKDFETFYKTACWARNRFPAPLFGYAFSVAVVHREDLQGVTVPPPYETYPFFYVASDVMQKSYQAKMRGYENYRETCDLFVDGKCVFYANHTDVYNYNNFAKSNYKLNYFTEDIGLNAFYYNWLLEHPYWFGSENYGKPSNQVGELFLYTHHQILARYYLERLSNGFGEVKSFDFWEPIEEGYVPHLFYPNGYEFFTRPEYTTIKMSESVLDLHTYQTRISDAIDSGFIFNTAGEKISLFEEKGVNYLGEIIFGYADAVNRPYYGELYNYLAYVTGHFNGIPKNYREVYPSVLHNIHTLLRDPVFYRLYKRIDNLYYKYIEHKNAYTKEELTFPGVYVKNFNVDKLVTYFDEYDTSLSYGVEVADEEDASKVNIAARHFRLNHEPYKFQFNVESDKQQTVMVRVFLGPKYDSYAEEIDFAERAKYFVEMDRFPFALNAGKNVIERNSQQSTVFVEDYKPYDFYFKGVTNEQYPRTCGFPERLALPRGSKSGVPYTFFVMVTPYSGEVDDKAFYGVPYCGAHFRQEYPDNLPMGFPFNRPVENLYTFHTPNMYFKDVVIYHKFNHGQNY